MSYSPNPMIREKQLLLEEYNALMEIIFQHLENVSELQRKLKVVKKRVNIRGGYKMVSIDADHSEKIVVEIQEEQALANHNQRKAVKLDDKIQELAEMGVRIAA